MILARNICSTASRCRETVMDIGKTMRTTIRMSYFITSLIIIHATNQAIAFDESELANSAEKLLQKWASVLSKDVISTTRGTDGLWRSSKHIFVGGSEDLSVVKTDLVVPAYHLIIKFKMRWVGVNSASKYAIPSPRKEHRPGFSTFEDSRCHLGESDFERPLGIMGYKVTYHLINGKWVLRDTDRFNPPIDNKTFYSDENKDLFKNLMSVPIDKLQ